MSTAAAQRAERPGADARAPTPVAALLAAGLVAAWGLPLVIMLAIVPKFEAIFRDFGVALPALTAWIIGASRWLRGGQVGQTVPGVVVVAPLLVIVLVAATLIALRWRRWPVLILFLLVPAISIPIFVVAMFVPLTVMIDSLQ